VGEEQAHQVLQLGPPVHNRDYQDKIQPTIVKHLTKSRLFPSIVDYQRKEGESYLKGTLSKKQVTKFNKGSNTLKGLVNQTDWGLVGLYG
jgi:hypothetical protein